LISGALFSVDELERDLELCDAALIRAAERGSATETAIANLCRAWPLYERGEITAAAEAARSGVDGLPLSGPSVFRTAYRAIALCHLQRGELDEAEAALAVIEHPELRSGSQLPWLLGARAQLRLAQRQPEAALNDAIAAGRRWDSVWGPTAASASAFPWRSIAAWAHLALGHSSQGHELASEELAAARATGMTRIIIRDLRILGLVEGGRHGLEQLESAARLGEQSPSRLEHIAALIALGGALRRANQRVAAREPLLEAIKLSQKGGASVLADQGQVELTATGARPRTTTRWGPEALTPSERRVAKLAADGLTTRAIAESLFVTPKTVEFHLRHIYQKVGVNSRDRLADALGDDG
jgi:ATP/maltotriose-dependent transcriptional regulator MalT